MKKNIIKISILSIIAFPILTFAKTSNLKDLIALVMDYLKIGIYFIISLAVIMFIWNVFRYLILGGENSKEKKEAGQYILWSVIGFFIILSFWGLVNIVRKTFDLDDTMPTTPFGSFMNANSNSGFINNNINNTSNDGINFRSSSDNKPVNTSPTPPDYKPENSSPTPADFKPR